MSVMVLLGMPMARPGTWRELCLLIHMPLIDIARYDTLKRRHIINTAHRGMLHLLKTQQRDDDDDTPMFDASGERSV